MSPFFAGILAGLAILFAPTLAVDHCTPPGEYQCAVLVTGSTLGFPTFSSASNGLSECTGVQIVNGSCDSILSSGSLGEGFYGDFGTTYGTELKFWANRISSDEINGINFLYDGDWYHEKECSTVKWGFDPAGQTQQCNFPC